MSQRPPILEHLLKKARDLPKQPGVYLMKDDKGRVLYIGKAAVLPNRVSSYFLPSADLGPSKQRMLDRIKDFDVIECESEWEALLTENRLIKDLHPPFNVLLTDGKSFPYLVITARDDFPGVFITREPTNPKFKNAKVLGPFTSVYALRESMKLLQRVFKFRTCELDIREDDDKRRFFRPCLLHAINQCSAPCADRISREDYNRDVDQLVRFMHSKRSVMLRQMRQDMQQASDDLDFETAAKLRDQIHAIEKLDDRGKRADNWQPETESFYTDPAKGLAKLRDVLNMDADVRCIECIDIAHLQGQQTVGAKVCFVDGRPLKNQYRRFKVHTAANDDFAAIREVVSRAYRNAGASLQLYPDLVIIDGGAGQISSALEAFEQFETKPPMVIALAKKEELIHKQHQAQPIKLGRENPALKICQAIRDEAHRFAQLYHHLLRKKKVIEE